jgi:hypothetical protein
MANHRIFTAVMLTVISLMFSGIFLNSPYQVWMVMAAIGLITGISFKTGQRHVITGFGIGLALTLLREYFTYGDVIRMTAPVYLAGYLFAIATSLAVRTLLISKFFRSSKTATEV